MKKKIISGLKQQIAELKGKFNANPNIETFKDLNEKLCTYTLIFNCRRPGELGCATLENYLKAKANDVRKEEIVEAFTAVEKQLMKNHFVMRIVGKFIILKLCIDNNRHRCCTALTFGPTATPG